MWRRKFRSLYEKIEFILSTTFLSRIYSRPTCADTFEKVGRKEARGRERKEEGEDRGGGRSGGRAYIYLCKRNRGIQLIVRSHTRGDSRDGYSGIVSACQFA